MGLSISHNTWKGAYSAFMRWRTEIAKCLGIPLSLMEGFYSRGENDSFNPLSLAPFYLQGSELALRQLNQHLENFPLLWDAFKPSPLHELLYHSDCDGEISWKKCKAIADALENLLPELPHEDLGGHIGDMQEKTKIFIAGCRLAYSKKENLQFR